MTKMRFSLATAFALVAALTLASCNDGLFGGDTGRIRMTLSGDVAGPNQIAASASLNTGGRFGEVNEGEDRERPSWWFQSAEITLSSILVRNLDGVLVNLDMDLPVTVDVVQIEGGKEVQLPDGLLPAGAYDQVVVVITAVAGVTRDGTEITVQPPGGGWTSIVPVCPLEVAEGSTTPIALKLMVRNSLFWNNGRFHFQPRFRPALDCDDDDDEDDEEVGG